MFTYNVARLRESIEWLEPVERGTRTVPENARYSQSTLADVLA